MGFRLSSFGRVKKVVKRKRKKVVKKERKKVVKWNLQNRMDFLRPLKFLLPLILNFFK